MTGATYQCLNSACVARDKKLWLNPSWPIGDIDAVIASPKVQADAELLANLQRRKEQGRKHALIQVPNCGIVPVVGYRFFFYCPKCKVIWEEDGMLNGATVLDPLTIAPKNYHCAKCQFPLEPSDTTNLNPNRYLPCPHCDKEMDKVYWHTQDK